MLHNLKKIIVRDIIFFLWNQDYLSFDDTIVLQETLKTMDCCTINHWLKELKPIFIEEYPATANMYKMA